jgi:energy-coupling factor transporter ATP-binding protein EcfA2
MRITNLGCIGPTGLEINLDEIVCLVGVNNTGKSTVLRAYEAAVTMQELKPEEIYAKAEGQPATVELWVHIPKDAENIDAKWKEESEGLLLVLSKWEWPNAGGKPVRTTWDPETKEYAENGKAAGLDTVFNSRLPKPLRIGSLEDPTEEHKKLLDLILEPIKTKLVDLMKDEGSDLRAKIKALQEEAEKPVALFKEDLTKVQKKVNASYQRVFTAAEIRLSVSLGELALDPGAALVKSSRVDVVESHGQTRWNQQGTGSQRALFWSMLEVRSELNRIAEQRRQAEKAVKEKEKELKKMRDKLSGLKKEDARQKWEESIRGLEAEIKSMKPGEAATGAAPAAPFLPGYMLLIDEPETALHPSAIRAAKEHLYSLASESGWQVMLSTHHPAFVDPLKDHTTIVRLHRPEVHNPPNVYRTDVMAFTGDEKENLKSLLAFDMTVAEMFFGSKVVIVEGDTEFAAFTEVMNADLAAFPLDGRPLIIRARGKATISTLIKMLAHFKLNCAVLHDIDSPMTTGGKRKNGAYTVNDSITKAVAAARTSSIHVIHRCSCPNFEQQHGMSLPDKDKPFETWKAVRASEPVKKSVRGVLDELIATPTATSAQDAGDGKHFEGKLKEWAKANAVGDAAYVFGGA